jgi:drug/metabolite transporter (DMT)-like permease
VRIAAVVLGLVLFGGLVVLAVAGVTAASAVMITAVAVVVMIGLGNAVGGRHTPNRSPYPPEPDPTHAAADDAGDAER